MQNILITREWQECSVLSLDFFYAAVCFVGIAFSSNLCVAGSNNRCWSLILSSHGMASSRFPNLLFPWLPFMSDLPHSCTVTALFLFEEWSASSLILLASSCFVSSHNFSSSNLPWYTTLNPIWLGSTVASDELDHECALPLSQHAVQRLWVPQVMPCSWWWQVHWWAGLSQIQHWSVTRWDLPWQEVVEMCSDWFPLQTSVGAQHESHQHEQPMMHWTWLALQTL